MCALYYKRKWRVFAKQLLIKGLYCFRVVQGGGIMSPEMTVSEGVAGTVFKYRSKALFYNLFLVNALPEAVL